MKLEKNILSTSVNSAATPFLKWAGGKRWLVPHIKDFIPQRFDRYIEPFLGSGAILFNLLPKVALISDINKDLIDTYISIAEDWSSVYTRLVAHDKKHSKAYYYKIRSSKPYSQSGKAARFIYLNRTCWNGLYRVNLKGEFNVPKGSKKRAILNSDNFELVAENLKNYQIENRDFESVIDDASSGDFIFIDPPYTLRHENNGFLKYNEKLFSWKDQVRLKEAVVRASKINVKVLITNASHPSVIKLYENFKSVTHVNRYSVIASESQRRKVVTEIIVKTY